MPWGLYQLLQAPSLWPENREFQQPFDKAPDTERSRRSFQTFQRKWEQVMDEGFRMFWDRWRWWSMHRATLWFSHAFMDTSSAVCRIYASWHQMQRAFWPPGTFPWKPLMQCFWIGCLASDGWNFTLLFIYIYRSFLARSAFHNKAFFSEKKSFSIKDLPYRNRTLCPQKIFLLIRKWTFLKRISCYLYHSKTAFSY